mmetsp:Transcript_15832/g.55078  ORF Transcript_15832/g.55078 Transcript_15832/m.55078 type:complete len:298 (+) Transcript_15832:2016-2909(+)
MCGGTGALTNHSFFLSTRFSSSARSPETSNDHDASTFLTSVALSRTLTATPPLLPRPSESAWHDSSSSLSTPMQKSITCGDGGELCTNVTTLAETNASSSLTGGLVPPPVVAVTGRTDRVNDTMESASSAALGESPSRRGRAPPLAPPYPRSPPCAPTRPPAPPRARRTVDRPAAVPAPAPPVASPPPMLPPLERGSATPSPSSLSSTLRRFARPPCDGSLFGQGVKHTVVDIPLGSLDSPLPHHSETHLRRESASPVLMPCSLNSRSIPLYSARTAVSVTFRQSRPSSLHSLSCVT